MIYRTVEQFCLPLLKRPSRVGFSAGGSLSLLNGIRGLAAIAILFWHYQHFFYQVGATAPVAGFHDRLPLYEFFWPLFDYGHYAVQIFWILSGIVFSYVYFDTCDSSRQFALSRFSRLYPLHVVTLVIVAALQHALLRQYGTYLIYVFNGPGEFVQQLAMVSGWGFPGGRESFNGPIWSVSAEIAVYAIFWLCRRWLFSRGVIWPLTLVAVGVLMRSAGIQNEIVRCMYHFMFGVAVFVAAANLAGRKHVLALGTSAIAVGLILPFVLPFRLVFPLTVLLVPGGVMVLAMAGERFVPAQLSKACNWIGDCTYGMYLWHIPVQLACFLLVAPAALSATAEAPGFLFGFVIGVVVLARVSFVLLEFPARMWLRSLGAKRAGSVAAG